MKNLTSTNSEAGIVFVYALSIVEGALTRPSSLGRSSFERWLNDHVVLVLLQLHHPIEMEQEFVKLRRLALLLCFHFLQLTVCPHIDTATDEDLQYKNEDEGKSVPVQRQFLLPITTRVRSR